jgi:hypothetical protein
MSRLSVFFVLLLQRATSFMYRPSFACRVKVVETHPTLDPPAPFENKAISYKGVDPIQQLLKNSSVDKVYRPSWEKNQEFHIRKGRAEFNNRKLIHHKRWLAWKADALRYMEQIKHTTPRIRRRFVGMKLLKDQVFFFFVM